MKSRTGKNAFLPGVFLLFAAVGTLWVLPNAMRPIELSPSAKNNLLAAAAEAVLEIASRSVAQARSFMQATATFFQTHYAKKRTALRRLAYDFSVFVYDGYRKAYTGVVEHGAAWQRKIDEWSAHREAARSARQARKEAAAAARKKKSDVNATITGIATPTDAAVAPSADTLIDSIDATIPTLESLEENYSKDKFEKTFGINENDIFYTETINTASLTGTYLDADNRLRRFAFEEEMTVVISVGSSPLNIVTGDSKMAARNKYDAQNRLISRTIWEVPAGLSALLAPSAETKPAPAESSLASADTPAPADIPAATATETATTPVAVAPAAETTAAPISDDELILNMITEYRYAGDSPNPSAKVLHIIAENRIEESIYTPTGLLQNFADYTEKDGKQTVIRFSSFQYDGKDRVIEKRTNFYADKTDENPDGRRERIRYQYTGKSTDPDFELYQNEVLRLRFTHDSNSEYTETRYFLEGLSVRTHYKSGGKVYEQYMKDGVELRRKTY